MGISYHLPACYPVLGFKHDSPTTIRTTTTIPNSTTYYYNNNYSASTRTTLIETTKTSYITLAAPLQLEILTIKTQQQPLSLQQHHHNHHYLFHVLKQTAAHQDLSLTEDVIMFECVSKKVQSRSIKNDSLDQIVGIPK